VGKALASVGREEFVATKAEDVNQEKIVKHKR
jgi:F-type H+-transporting ATPase subunit alpha